jgi:hypothetical protein
MSLEASLSYSIHYAPRSFLLRIAKAMELKTKNIFFSGANHRAWCSNKRQKKQNTEGRKRQEASQKRVSRSDSCADWAAETEGVIYGHIE